MALYIPHSIFHLARLLYVRPETFGPYCVLEGIFAMTVDLATGIISGKFKTFFGGSLKMIFGLTMK